VVRSSGVRLDSQSVVHGNPELLLASEVALCRLDGNVAEQELDLIQFTAREVAEAGARAPQIVRGQLCRCLREPLRRASHHTAPSVTCHLAGHGRLC
jgi:hypothetical protein